jgi:hypothetical protein
MGEMRKGYNILVITYVKEWHQFEDLCMLILEWVVGKECGLDAYDSG